MSTTLEVIKVVKLILVMPATNAVSERSFSALHMLKTWLHTTTVQVQLKWYMYTIMHVYKDKTNALLMSSMAIEFVVHNHLDKDVGRGAKLSLLATLHKHPLPALLIHRSTSSRPSRFA